MRDVYVIYLNGGIVSLYMYIYVVE